MSVGRVPDSDLARVRKFNPGSLQRVLDDWQPSADAVLRYAVSAILMDVGQGLWVEQRSWVRDTHNPNLIHLAAPAGLVVSVLLMREYPDTVQLVYIGPMRAE